MRKSLPQKEKVLNHLIKKGSLTSIEAINRYGITRLASYICQLKKTYKIRAERVVKKKQGKTVQFARYVWGKKEAA
jgi:DNA-directed RNA polymerase specialized sigma subunit